jgi:hypothetical protein
MHKRIITSVLIGVTALPLFSAATANAAIVKLTVMADSKMGTTGMGAMSSKSKGSANATFNFDASKGQLCYTVSAKGLPSITAAHIEPNVAPGAKTTAQDELFIKLSPASIGKNTATCLSVKPKWINFVLANPSHYDFMIHTKQYPDGAVAGLLTKSM